MNLTKELIFDPIGVNAIMIKQFLNWLFHTPCKGFKGCKWGPQCDVPGSYLVCRTCLDCGKFDYERRDIGGF